MALHLRIENVPSLPDGGPVEISVSGKRGIDIGRDSHLDWTLPDPTRYISGKHAEIRYREGGYWLHDVSTNGTFLYGSDHRMQAPRRLRNGDRFTIGHYIIAVALDEEAGAGAPLPAPGDAPAAPAPHYQELWSMPGDAPPPIDPKQLRSVRQGSPIRPDFLDWAADVPNPLDEPVMPAPASTPSSIDPRLDEEMDWARGVRSPAPEPAPPPSTPAPRRPAPVRGEAAQAWDDSVATSGRGAASRAPAQPEAVDKSPPAPPLVSPPTIGGQIDDFLHHLALAARVPEEIFAHKDAKELAEQLGETLRIVVDNLSQLLNARGQAKRMVRSASHTVIQATNNNPLKFSPSVEDALRIMFGPPTRRYLDAREALARGFEDIKTHEIKTYAAMQHALARLLADLDPQTIERETEADRGIAAVVTSRKAKLWDAYVSRWQAKQGAESGGLVDAYMRLFGQFYDDHRG